MKFHCDRCKTRYSIADERVRGKILKIRCKNCSTVITVKDGAQSAQAVQASPVQASPAQRGAARPARATTGGAPRKRAGDRSGARRRPTTSSGSALQGAFEEALRRPDSGAAAEMAGAPAVLEAEWYVSQDGEQLGPLSLARAQEWVADRGGDEELFCWSEGFDDWLPVEKVSHFRGLRAGRPASGLLAMPPGMAPRSSHGDEVEETLLHSTAGILPAREETPVPLFAATLAQVTADAPADDPPLTSARRNGSVASPLGPHGPGGRAPSGSPPGGGSLFGPALAAAGPVGANGSSNPGETGPDLAHDLEIGEASRVVKLPMLARPGNGDASPLGAPGLPGMGAAAGGVGSLGRGTGSHDQGGRAASVLPLLRGASTLDLPRSEAMLPRRRRSSMIVPLGIGAAAVLGVVSVFIFVALSDDDDSATVRRGEVGGKGGLAYTFDDEDGDKKQVKPAEVVKAPARRPPRRTSGAGKSSASLTTTTPQGPSPIGSDEVDLSGGPAGELDPDDLFDVYNANKIGVTMCYNSALKRDPLLGVRRADVVISVSPSGSVASVSIPSLSGTPLGTCLQKRIKAWRFPRASRVFNSRFPIVFGT